MKFKLRSLLIFITAICVLVAFVAALPRIGKAIYYSERNEINAFLSKLDSIENVKFSAFDDGILEEVVSVSFSVKGKPNSTLTIVNMENPSDGLRLGRIGDVAVWRTGILELDGGTKTTFFQMGVDFALLQTLTSKEIKTVDDVIDHYDEILEVVQAMPIAAGEETYVIGGNKYSYFQQIDPKATSSAKPANVSTPNPVQ